MLVRYVLLASINSASTDRELSLVSIVNRLPFFSMYRLWKDRHQGAQNYGYRGRKTNFDMQPFTLHHST